MNQFVVHRPPRPPTPDELTRLIFGFGADELVSHILDGKIPVQSDVLEKEAVCYPTPASNIGGGR